MASEAGDKTSLEQEVPDASENNHNNASANASKTSEQLPQKENSEDVDSSPQASVTKHILPMTSEANMSGNLEPIETATQQDRTPHVKPDLLTQQAVKISEAPIESQLSDQTSIPSKLVESDSDPSEATEDGAGIEPGVGNATIYNENHPSETDVKVGGSVDNLLVSEDNMARTPATLEKKEMEYQTPIEGSSQSFTFHQFLEGDDSGSEEEQTAFMKELENFYIERSMEFKPPKFYGEGINCLKLWREVTRLGGYEQVTASKLWRQVGESFRPPKTCTTVSWTFRIFYEKALLEYEKHKIQTGELKVPASAPSDPMGADNQVTGNPTSGSGRARRDAAARAMQGWHSQRQLGYGEVGDPIIKDKNPLSVVKRDKNVKTLGSPKKRKAATLENAAKVSKGNSTRSESDIMVADVGNPADWVKINVRRTKDCFEVYALVPGLLREEVQVQSDPAGRLIISGEPEQPDNPWGVTPFKKVITLPSRIDPHQTSAVVTLHGQLLVRAPFELSDL